MSQSLLYHAFGVREGYEYIRTRYEGGDVVFRIRPNEPCRCQHCQSENVVKHDTRLRKVRTLPIGFRPVWLEVETPRLRCKDCGELTLQSPPLFVEKSN